MEDTIADKDGKMIVEQMKSAAQATTKVSLITKGDEKEKIKIFGKYFLTAAKVISKFAR